MLSEVQIQSVPNSCGGRTVSTEEWPFAKLFPQEQGWRIAHGTLKWHAEKCADCDEEGHVHITVMEETTDKTKIQALRDFQEQSKRVAGEILGSLLSKFGV